MRFLRPGTRKRWRNSRPRWAAFGGNGSVVTVETTTDYQYKSPASYYLAEGLRSLAEGDSLLALRFVREAVHVLEGEAEQVKGL